MPYNKQNRITEDVINSVRELCNKGLSHKEIAFSIGRSKTAIDNICTIYKISNNHYHNLRKHPLYSVHNSILERCKNKNNHRYKDYGGRGIKVCLAFSNRKYFIHWALQNKYSSSLQIDRIDNNLHYSCGNCNECIENNWLLNCKFSTVKENANNRRNNRFITAFSETKTLSKWLEDDRCKCELGCLTYRLNNGWCPEKAISEYPKRNN